MTSKEKIVVLGAGIGGLSAAYFAARTGKYDVIVLEKSPVIGGLCASFEFEEFTLDYGAHKIYSVIPGILDEIQSLMGERLLELEKRNKLYLRGHLVDYPLQLGNLASVLGLGMFIKIGFGYALEVIKGFFFKKSPKSYEAYMIQRFGKPAYELVFQPLADKVWGDPITLHPEMARARIPASGGIEVILKLLGLKKETLETNAELFYYPRLGFGDFPNTVKNAIKEYGGSVDVNAEIQGFVIEADKIVSVGALVDGKEMNIPANYVISSIPLSSLGLLLYGKEEIQRTHSIDSLQFRHLILVYVFINQSLVLEDQWIFFPEKKYIFSRIFEQKQMNADLGPEERTAICCDFTCSDGSELCSASDDELSERCVEGLIEARFIERKDVTGTMVKRVRNFYPRYDLEYTEKMKALSRDLQRIKNLLLTGRIGMYNYNNSDHCFDMGRFIADHLAIGEEPVEIWNKLEKRVANYRIID